MFSIIVNLNGIEAVKNFVSDVCKFDYDFDLVRDRYVIDAKSIMGVFSLDLSKPIQLNIHVERDSEAAAEVMQKLIVYSVQ